MEVNDAPDNYSWLREAMRELLGGRLRSDVVSSNWGYSKMRNLCFRCSPYSGSVATALFVVGCLAPVHSASSQHAAAVGAVSSASRPIEGALSLEPRHSKRDGAVRGTSPVARSSLRPVILASFAGAGVGGVVGYLQKIEMVCPNSLASTCSGKPQRRTVAGIVSGALVGAVVGAAFSVWR